MRTLLLRRAAHIPRGCRGRCESWVPSRDPDEEEKRERQGVGEGRRREEVREAWRAGRRGERDAEDRGDSKPAFMILAKILHPSLKFPGTLIHPVWKESHVRRSGV